VRLSHNSFSQDVFHFFRNMKALILFTPLLLLSLSLFLSLWLTTTIRTTTTTDALLPGPTRLRSSSSSSSQAQNDQEPATTREQAGATATVAAVPVNSKNDGLTTTTTRILQRLSSLVVATMPLWVVKSMFFSSLLPKLVHFSAPTTSCHTGNTAFADRVELDGAINQFIADGNYANLQQYGAMNEWDVSQITDFLHLLDECDIMFNEDISCWDVSNGVNFGSMFRGATSFNQDIGGWNMGY
jgi:Mycoplasma protein of unknown function, DUF285